MRRKTTFHSKKSLIRCHKSGLWDSSSDIVDIDNLYISQPDNGYVKEAIKVSLKGLGQIGYVANSTYTVLGESYSAGRLYDKIGKKAKGEVLMKLNNGVLCRLYI